MNTGFRQVISLSGGQTSAYMLWLLMQQHPDFAERFIILFQNTGKEHDATLLFLREIERHWGVIVIWLEYTRVPARSLSPEWFPEGQKRKNLLRQQDENVTTHWFKVVTFDTATRRTDPRSPFDELLEWMRVLPNVTSRACSAYLKFRTAERYLNYLQTGPREDHIGIRFDEADRATEILANADDRLRHPKFPLIDAKVVKSHVDGFWDKQAFRLTIPNYLGNCDLCFLKSRWKRLAIARRDPAAAKWWADWEKRKAEKIGGGNGSEFIDGKSYAALITEAGQPELALDFSEQDIPCSCAAGRYRETDEEARCA